MKKLGWLSIAAVLLISVTQSDATGWRKDSGELRTCQRRIAGRIEDYTCNHGKDNRIWSPALGQRRDLYVYLPPNYSSDMRYPIVVFLHGFAVDEQSFLEVAPLIDQAIQNGKLPPLIVAAPDGSLPGEPCLMQPGSFFINSNAGAFEDFVLRDTLGFVAERYPLRPEREAHVLAGASMGGFGAFNLGLRHKQSFGIVVGIFPPLNLRWLDNCCNYMANFSPQNWNWRTSLDRRHEVVAKFACGLVKLHISQFVEPLFGMGDQAVHQIARNNPIELIDTLKIRNGDLAMYVGYGGKDEFNIDAQVESFLYLCKERGISVGVGYEPHGRHDMATALRLWPGLAEWLGPRLQPYTPIPVSAE
ncbi:MAG: hypothetical protein L0215_11035 [Gemmataceae bacterium]|nr:hypothetical protein [Gemmataceae bacterium]